MNFQSSIMKNTSTLLDEMIHITPRCVVQLHSHLILINYLNINFFQKCQGQIVENV